MENIEHLIKKINGMFRPCNDMVKTDPKDIEQENIDNAYNLALSDVLNLFKKKNVNMTGLTLKINQKENGKYVKNVFLGKNYNL